MKVVAVVPIKMNNERALRKTIKPLSDGTPLIKYILSTLKKVKRLDSIYVYRSQEEIKNYLLSGIRYLKRDEKFDTVNADFIDMLYTFSLQVNADIYVLAHETSLFLSAGSISNAIENILSGEHDSAFTVKRVQEFIWKNGSPWNYSLTKIPRTQDLEPMYVDITGLYVYTKEVIQKMRRRVGNKPYLLEASEIDAVDINMPIDFEIANAIYTQIILKDKSYRYIITQPTRKSNSSISGGGYYNLIIGYCAPFLKRGAA